MRLFDLQKNMDGKKLFASLAIGLLLFTFSYPFVVVSADSTTGGGGASYDMGGTKAGEQGDCNVIGNFGECVVNLFNFLVITPSALLLGVSGVFLNLVITITIENFSKFILGTGDGVTAAITTAWTLIRDVLNMVFIFMLLYIGIGTIIGLDKVNYQKAIPKIVIAGLLINFSFFFTSILIDVSNVTTMQFYESINKIGQEYNGDISSVSIHLERGLSGAFMNGLRIRHATPDAKADTGQMIFMAIFSSITFLVAAFLFLGMSGLLIVRYVILIVLLVTSPIAVMGGILPQLDAQKNKWWKELNNQLIFAPVFMLFMLLVVLLINSDGFQTAVRGSYENVSFGGESIGAMLAYTIAIGLMLTGLVTAKQFAGQASNSFTDWAQKKAQRVATSPMRFAQWGGSVAGRNVIGYGADKLGTGYTTAMGKLSRLETKDLSGIKKFAGTVGKGVAKGAIKLRADEAIRDKFKATAASRFGGSESYSEAQKAITQRKKELGQAVREDEAQQRIKAGFAVAEELKTTGNYDTGVVRGKDKDGKDIKPIENFLGEVAKFTDKKIEEMLQHDLETLKKQTFASALTGKQMEAINKSDLISDIEKKAISDAREAGLKARIEKAPTQEAKIAEGLRMANRGPADVAQLPKDIILMPEVAGNLSAPVLNQILRDGKMDEGTRTKLRTEIERQHNILTNTAFPLSKEQQEQKARLDKIMGWFASNNGQFF